MYEKIQYIVKMLDNGERANEISEYVLLVWETERKLMGDISVGDDE